jgi:nucleoside-diphosphate-sugar epimerase
MPYPDPSALLIRSEVERLLPYIERTSLTGKRLFITGGTGFFGYWILVTLRVLVERGLDIKATVLSRAPARFVQANPEFQGIGDWLTFLEGDVRQLGSPDEPYDWYIHGATDTDAASQSRPLEIFETLLTGTQRLLEHARAARAKRVLLLSSGAVYGNASTRGDPISEDCVYGPSSMDPSQAYAEGKRAMEMAGTLYNAAGFYDVISARCFAFVGPRLPLDAHFAIGNFIADALHRDHIEVKGTGTPVRSYLYIGDAVVWLLRLLQQGSPGSAYNVGSAKPHTIFSLAQLTAATLAPGKPVITQGTVTADSSRSFYVPKTTQAEALGLTAWTDLQQAIRVTAQYHLLRSAHRSSA